MRKTCFRCGEKKPLDDFYKHPDKADGRLGKCKDCTKEDVARNRSTRRSQYAAYERQRFQQPKRKAQVVETQRRSRARNADKCRARNAVNNAIREGLLERGVCEVCGEKAEAHHEDYSQPFEVRWLCFAHHRTEHGQVVDF